MLKRSLSRHHQGTLNGAPVRQRFMSPQQSTEVPGANCSTVSTSQPFRPKTKRFSMLTRNRCSYRGLNNYNRAFGGHYTIYLQERNPQNSILLIKAPKVTDPDANHNQEKDFSGTPGSCRRQEVAPAAGVSVPLSPGIWGSGFGVYDWFRLFCLGLNVVWVGCLQTSVYKHFREFRGFWV